MKRIKLLLTQEQAGRLRSLLSITVEMGDIEEQGLGRAEAKIIEQCLTKLDKAIEVSRGAEGQG